MWHQGQKEDSRTPHRRSDMVHKLTVPNLVSPRWLWGRWGYKRHGVQFGNTEKNGQRQAQGHTPSQCTQELVSIQKDSQNSSKSGNFVLLGEKICIMVVLYTQTPTHSICTPRQPGGKAFLHTIYGCLPPAYTHSQWFYSGPGCSCCQVTLSTPPGGQLNAKCCTLVPWQVLGTNL